MTIIVQAWFILLDTIEMIIDVSFFCIIFSALAVGIMRVATEFASQKSFKIMKGMWT